MVLRGMIESYHNAKRACKKQIDFLTVNLIRDPEPPTYKKRNFPRTYKVVEFPGTVSKTLPVPSHIVKPDYENEYEPSSMVEYKSDEEIVCMQQSCSLARRVLDAAGRFIRVGMTTDELDKYCHNLIIQNNAYPSPLGFNGFPKSICTSVNNIAIHGIPDDRRLKNGDIISVDVTVFKDGFHGDCASTFLVGDVDPAGRRLVDSAKRILYSGIQGCGPKKFISSIAEAIDREAEFLGYTVMPSVTGHDIGQYFHGSLTINHTKCDDDIDIIMMPGMVFTIEPVITDGDGEAELLEDGWTVATQDDSRTAQFEHTVLITETGVRILTE